MLKVIGIIGSEILPSKPPGQQVPNWAADSRSLITVPLLYHQTFSTFLAWQLLERSINSNSSTKSLQLHHPLYNKRQLGHISMLNAILFYYKSMIKNKSLHSVVSVYSSMVQNKTIKCHQVFEMKEKSNIPQTFLSTKCLQKNPWTFFVKTVETLTNVH